MDQVPEDAPMARDHLAGSEEALVLSRPRSAANSRALKVAGLTTLACLLLASQVFTAYMVFGQKQQIHELQKNSEQMGRELTRSPKVPPVRMRMPMNNLPLLMTFPEDSSSKPAKTPAAKIKDAVVSVEKQVKDFIQDFQLPQFNETFMANLQSMKSHMNETEWQSFESWMRYWLIFQMAQRQPAPPTASPVSLIKTKCQEEAGPGPSKIGTYKPQCDEQGNYKPVQCWRATGFCWCVDKSGTAIEGTSVRGYPDCERGAAPRRLMLAPSLMQKTLSINDDE